MKLVVVVERETHVFASIICRFQRELRLLSTSVQFYLAIEHEETICSVNASHSWIDCVEHEDVSQLSFVPFADCSAYESQRVSQRTRLVGRYLMQMVFSATLFHRCPLLSSKETRTCML